MGYGGWLVDETKIMRNITKVEVAVEFGLEWYNSCIVGQIININIEKWDIKVAENW